MTKAARHILKLVAPNHNLFAILDSILHGLQEESFLLQQGKDQVVHCAEIRYDFCNRLE